MRHSTVTFKLLACCAGLLLGSTGLDAQTIYRIVGPDGKVTYSDRAPADAKTATATGAGGRPIASPENNLPYELRQVASRYPVTLYSGATCAPCNAGRLMLQSRGVPFTEYTVSTQEDAEALQRVSGDNSLPFLTIGGQKIKGYSEAEWTQFLNAANYPATSALPANYRNAQAKPLVAEQKPAAAPNQPQAPATSEEKSAASETSAPPAVAPSSPGGIRF